ncbi:G-patch domain containing protein [Nitzschia inconspicua]|uniref:G-patch domain containing protein n=1 Tax=Nitzschia inconspicua TaxID=303405 RepID=A0A9K3PL30_9STRA|nr:G-patch domain containing protein [Nitzschia inconspicua]
MATVKTASPTDAVVSSTSDIFLALAGSKHKRKLGATLNESAAVGPNDFAKRQLEKLGWKEGTGLGKKRDGRSTHIRVKQRAHESGLGSTSTDIDPVVSADQWWKSSVGNTLAKLSAKQKTKKSKKNSKKEKKKDVSDDDTDDVPSQKTRTKVYTDEELFQATGGVRFGMRAQTQQRSKWKRAESNISQEEEEQAKQMTEWDGLSAPRVVLSTTTDGSDTKRSNKRSRDTTESSSTPLQKDESKKEEAEEEVEQSKKRKKSKSKSDDENEKSSKKKMKKEKKSKKKKKEKNKDDQ